MLEVISIAIAIAALILGGLAYRNFRRLQQEIDFVRQYRLPEEKSADSKTCFSCGEPLIEFYISSGTPWRLSPIDGSAEDLRRYQQNGFLAFDMGDAQSFNLGNRTWHDVRRPSGEIVSRGRHTLSRVS